MLASHFASATRSSNEADSGRGASASSWSTVLSLQQDHELLAIAAGEARDVRGGHASDDPALLGEVVERLFQPIEVELTLEILVLGCEQLVLLDRMRFGVRREGG